jgi:hypothetical protein
MTMTVQKMSKEIRLTLDQLPEPFLGRILLEVVKEDSNTYKKEQYGITENSALKDFVIMDGTTDSETGEFRAKELHSVPYKKGKILKMAPDAYGAARFQKYYGTEGYVPKIGDTVLFIPNQSYKIDPADVYHIIADDHVIGYFKN